MTESSQSYSWTQPICDDCWDRDHPFTKSPRAGQVEREQCVHCEEPTRSGLYIRVDPATASYPSLVR